MFVVFLGNTLEGNKELSLMKVPQWCVFNSMMAAATQRLGGVQKSPNLELKTWFLAWKNVKTLTLTTTTTGSKITKRSQQSD